MKTLLTRFLILALAALSFCSCDYQAAVLPAEKGEKGFNIDPRVDNLWTQVNESADGFDTTYYFDFILAASHLGWDQKYIQVALERFSAQQIREGANLGKVPRNVGGDYSDENNIEFALELGCVALIEYADSFSEKNRELLYDFIDYALHASWGHDNVAVYYSNIYIMRVWNMIALGENLPKDRTWGRDLALSPETIAGKGYSMLRAWYDQVKTFGIHEHNSPTYTGVQAECLGYLARYTKDEQSSILAKKALSYLSAMIFANYFTPAKVLTGPMSRCYYRGSSGGKIDQLAGGLIYGYGMYWYNELAAWEPSPQDREINSTYPRLVAWTFGPDKETDAASKEYWSMNGMNYIDRKFSISSAGHHYTGNGTEKTVSVVVAGDAHRSICNVAHYMEGRNDPYGKINYGSHTWTCFRDAYARSQHDGEFVFLQAGNGRDNPPKPENLVSSIIVPGTYVDEMWIGNDRIADWLTMPGNSAALSSESGNTYFLRIEDIVISIRYLFTFGVDGKDKVHTLINESCNYVNGQALRISTSLKDTEPVQGDLGGVVMWWRVDKDINTDAQFAVLRQKIIDAPVSAPAQRQYGQGDEFECYVTTPEGLKLGIKGNFEKRSYYNRYIMTDTNPEYLKEQYWFFAQKEAYGSSIDFSDREQAYLSVNKKDIGTALTKED